MDATQLLLEKFGVKDVAEIDPFVDQPVEAHSLPTQVTKTETLRASSGNMTLRGDDVVSVRTIFIRHAKNPNSEVVYLVNSYTHPASAPVVMDSVRLQVSMGGIPGCALELAPESDTPQSEFLLRETRDSLILQPDFIKMYMLLNERVLMNGIISLSPEVCARSEFPSRIAVANSEGELYEYDADHYVLIPFRHVLAWKLQISPNWRIQQGYFALEMRVAPKGEGDPFILYYAVDNHTFDRLKTDCMRNLAVIDKTPLNEVGIGVHGSHPLPVEVTTTFTYIVYPKEVDEKTLAPTIPDKMPPFSRILEKKVQAKRYAEQDAAEKRKREAEEEATAMDTSD